MVVPIDFTAAAEHYWPGAALTLPLPDGGLALTFNNRFIKDLPIGPTDVDVIFQEHGGEHRPSGAPTAGWDILFHLVGEGKWVDFWCLGLGVQGPAVILFERAADGSAWFTAPMPDNGGYEGGGGLAQISAIPGQATTDPAYRAAVALRVFLKAGTQYVLQIGSSSISTAAADAAAALGYTHGAGGFDQDFYLEMSYTPLVLPDFKTNAYEVIVPHDGATYTSPDVLNTTFTTSAEDPQGVGHVWVSSWWHYKTAVDAHAMTVAFAVLPQYSVWFGCVVWLRQSDGTMVLLGQNADSPPNTFTIPTIGANTDVYIQIFGTDFYNQHQAYAQKYQLQVTAAKSIIQTPDTNLGPPNDLRANATTVSISSDDNTYLSDDTTLTYAIPGAVGAGPPWPTGSDGRYADDPEASPLYQTAWWSYKPIVSGSATLRAHSTSVDISAAQVMLLDANLALLDVKLMGQDLVFPTVALHTYFIVLGTKDPGTSLSSSFSVVGSPTGGTPPINDLRAHAIAVTIAHEGDTYLATNTRLDYATPAAVGSGAASDPVAIGLYQTAWWVYKPQADGQAQIRAHSDPANSAPVKLMVLHGSTPMATVAMSTDYTQTVAAGQTYYYVLGTTGQVFASASFGVTGSASLYNPPSGPWKLNLLMPGGSWKTLISGTT